jgi:hypothetical protein
VSGGPWLIVKPCGTEAAYRRHKRLGERPCPEDYAAAARAAVMRRAYRTADRRERLAHLAASDLLRELVGVIAAECKRAGYFGKTRG